MTHGKPEAVVIGVSAGGLSALSTILPTLPADYPLPIMTVIHLPPDRNSLVAPLFHNKCALSVVEAEDKVPIAGGTVYFAPPDYHMLVEPNRHLSLSSEEPVLYSRPSVDILFETAADTYGKGLIGVILTGASDDGAAGLRAVIAAGGTGLIECPDKAYATAMPKAALKLNPNAHVMSLEQIALYLQKAAKP